MAATRKRLAKPGEDPAKPAKKKARRAPSKASAAKDARQDLTTVASALSAVSAKKVHGKSTKRKAVKRQTAKGGAPIVQTYSRWESEMSVREKRVDEIARRMMQGAWLAGVSGRMMAKEWNVSPAVVEQASAEASRVLRRALREGPEFLADVQLEVIQTYRVIRQQALRLSGDKNFGDSARVAALGVALNATRLYGFYLGIEPDKNSPAGKVETVESEFDNWSAEELDHYANTREKPKTAR